MSETFEEYSSSEWTEFFSNTDVDTVGPIPRLVITEQPASNKLRFRYGSECKTAGTLQGVNSTPQNKTYPSIKIEGYQGKAEVVVSCVESNPPHRAHPHNLVGRGKAFKDGVCVMEIREDTMTCSFQSIGIQCVKKEHRVASYLKREKIKVDPFKQGFNHKVEAVDTNSVRLCFQAFITNEKSENLALEPVLSDVINDQKSQSDLQILEHSDNSSPAIGGKKILLFCNRVSKEDIQVYFFSVNQEFLGKGELNSRSIYRRLGISFKTPPYVNQEINEPVQCKMCLFRPSDNTMSAPVDFWFKPNNQKSQPESCKSSHRKRRRKTETYDEMEEDIKVSPPKLIVVEKRDQPMQQPMQQSIQQSIQQSMQEQPQHQTMQDQPQHQTMQDQPQHQTMWHSGQVVSHTSSDLVVNSSLETTTRESELYEEMEDEVLFIQL